MKMGENDKGFLRLILRSPDKGDGWRSVSATLWPLVSAFKHQELLETKDDNMVRLSDRGLTIIDYIRGEAMTDQPRNPSEALKPCPFDGGKMYINEVADFNCPIAFQAHCDKCSMATGTFAHLDDLVTFINTRALHPAPVPSTVTTEFFWLLEDPEGGFYYDGKYNTDDPYKALRFSSEDKAWEHKRAILHDDFMHHRPVEHGFDVTAATAAQASTAMAAENERLRENIMLIDKIAFDSGGKTEFKMNRIWHMTQQILAAHGEGKS